MRLAPPEAAFAGDGAGAFDGADPVDPWIGTGSAGSLAGAPGSNRAGQRFIMRPGLQASKPNLPSAAMALSGRRGLGASRDWRASERKLLSSLRRPMATAAWTA